LVQGITTSERTLVERRSNVRNCKPIVFGLDLRTAILPDSRKILRECLLELVNLYFSWGLAAVLSGLNLLSSIVLFLGVFLWWLTQNAFF
jgi:hypothetical protein